MLWSCTWPCMSPCSANSCFDRSFCSLDISLKRLQQIMQSRACMFVACVCSCINTCISIYGRYWDRNTFRHVTLSLMRFCCSRMSLNNPVFCGLVRTGRGLGGTRSFSLCVARSARCLASLSSGFARARSARPLLGGVRYPYFETIGNASNSSSLLPIF